jgi:diguanylate cyclase (GGDEF)-like protein/PAS domain S-box-containing protein
MRVVTRAFGERTAARTVAREPRLASVVANLTDIVSVVDAGGTLLFVGANAGQVWGRAAEDRVGASIFDFLHPDDVGLTAERLMMVQDTPGPAAPFEVRALHADGDYRIFETTANNQLDNPEVGGIILVSRDVTERHRVEASLRESEQRFTRIFETAAVGITIVDLEGRFVRVNKAYAKLLGYRPDELVSRTIFELSHPDELGRTAREFEQLMAGEQDEYSLDKRLRAADGSWVWVRLTASVVRDELGQPQYTFGHIVDISEIHALAERLAHEASHDPLTGLATRGLLDEHLTRALAQAARSGEAVGVLFIDLDGFKVINDAHGHAAGDDVLVELARRLAGLVRASDLVARYGGDEFVIALSRLAGTADAIDVAKRVVHAISAPFGVPLALSASVGVAISHGDEDAGVLVARADVAAYDAKRAGKGGFAVAP